MNDEPVLGELVPQISLAISDDHDVFVGGEYIRFHFSESEFSVRLRDESHRRRCVVKFTAVMRAAVPDGDTWWAGWSVSCRRDAVGTVVAEEVTNRRQCYRRMVAENIRRRM